MKTTKYRNSFLALIAIAMPQAASAMLLVGWHDFNGNTGSEGADFQASGFTGTVTKGGETSVTGGGSNDGFYGNSGFSTGVSPAGIDDGYLRILNSTLTFSLTNNTSMDLFLAGLFFDAALQSGTGSVTVDYNISATGESGSFDPVSNTASSGSAGASANYGDFFIGLGAIPAIAANQTINFLFTASPNARIDNIAITAIPEPASLLALGMLLSSGLLFRSRRSANAVV